VCNKTIFFLKLNTKIELRLLKNESSMNVLLKKIWVNLLGFLLDLCVVSMSPAVENTLSLQTPFMARYTQNSKQHYVIKFVSDLRQVGGHDITEILLRVALNTINQTKPNYILTKKMYRMHFLIKYYICTNV
jgi:hypothetical protein